MENRYKNLQKKKKISLYNLNEFKGQPARYRFFDNEYAIKNNKFIENKSIRKRLHEEANLAKIVFNYKKNYNQFKCLDGEFFNVDDHKMEFYDIFSHLNITSSIAKVINRLKKQNKLVNYVGDFNVLSDYYLEANAKFREVFRVFSNQNDYLDCLHPYIRRMLLTTDSNLLELIDGDDYKKAEANFIRTANSNFKKVVDSLKANFIGGGKIFICRFDVIFRSDGGVRVADRCSISQYKKQVDSLFKTLEQFSLVLDVIFPTAMLTGEMIPSHSPVGQIVLVASERVSANLKGLKEFASQGRLCELLKFEPARPFPKGLAPSVDGVLEFNPSSFEAINRLAEFLTLERRFVAPRQGGADRAGTTHCMRFV